MDTDEKTDQSGRKGFQLANDIKQVIEPYFQDFDLGMDDFHAVKRYISTRLKGNQLFFIYAELYDALKTYWEKKYLEGVVNPNVHGISAGTLLNYAFNNSQELLSQFFKKYIQWLHRKNPDPGMLTLAIQNLFEKLPSHAYTYLISEKRYQAMDLPESIVEEITTQLTKPKAS